MLNRVNSLREYAEVTVGTGENRYIGGIVLLRL